MEDLLRDYLSRYDPHLEEISRIIEEEPSVPPGVPPYGLVYAIDPPEDY